MECKPCRFSSCKVFKPMHDVSFLEFLFSCSLSVKVGLPKKNVCTKEKFFINRVRMLDDYMQCCICITTEIKVTYSVLTDS